jgi:hypothetical protein
VIFEVIVKTYYKGVWKRNTVFLETKRIQRNLNENDYFIIKLKKGNPLLN